MPNKIQLNSNIILLQYFFAIVTQHNLNAKNNERKQQSTVKTQINFLNRKLCEYRNQNNAFLYSNINQSVET